MGAGSTWPIVARDDEFRRALAALSPGAEFQGVALVGDSGVGKSTLARALANSLEADGWTVRFALGTETGRDVPLGAFSRAVMVDTAREPVAMLAGAHQTLDEEENLVVVVDDAQLLDPLSATLVYQLAAGGNARLIITIRSGEQVFDAVAALLKERLLLDLHIDPFSIEQTAELARRVLGGIVEPRLIDALRNRSGGNLLLLRGLLSAGRESGVLVQADGGWQLRGPLRPDRELYDLLEFRLRSLTPAEREAVELLAVGELLDWEILRELCDNDAATRLEQRGMIQLVADGSYLVAQLNHPIIGEAAVRLAGVVRSRQLNGVLAQAIAEHLRAGGRRSRLPDLRGRIRLAQYMMRSDLPPDLDVIVTAASSAMSISNFGYAEELARFAYERGGGLPAAFVLGDALSWQGRGNDAEAVLADADLGGVDELAAVRWCCLRAGNLFWNCRDVDRARQVLADVEDRVDSKAGIALVQALQTSLTFFCGDLVTTIEAGSRLCASGATPLAVTWAAVPTSLALALAGQFADVDRVAQAALRADALSESGAQRFAIGLAEVMAATAAGDHPAAERVWKRYAAMAAGIPEADAMVHAIRGHVHSSCGDLSSACSAFHDSVSVLAHGFPSAWLMLVMAWQAQAEGARGNAAAAAAALRCSEEAYGPQAAVFLPELELARAWVQASAGQKSDGLTHAVAAAKTAHRSGMWALEMRARHTATRFADRSHVARLTELARMLNTPLADAIAAHARSLADHDGDALDVVAGRFTELGALALAADAAAQAAREHARSGNRGKELGAAARAHWLASQGDIRTPAVDTAERPLPITDREREVALLVVAGLSNRQIADQLSVSVRTVGGHLYRMFAKLGIERREQLFQLFIGIESGA